MTNKQLWLFCDGATGALEAPPLVAGSRTAWRKYFQGESGCAAAAVARNGRGQIVGWRWRRLPVVSNNEAEYAALLLGMEVATELQAPEVYCVMDSEIVIGQMSGHFAVHSHHLRPLHWQACAAVRKLPSVHFCLIPREWNRLADGLAGQTLMPWHDLCKAITAFNREAFV